MATMQQPQASSPPMARRRGRSWLWLGVGVFLLGVVLFIVQAFLLKILVVPWYMPIMFTVGALFVLVAFSQRPTWTRGIVLVLLGLLSAGEWFFILSLSRLPEYIGPAQV